LTGWFDALLGFARETILRHSVDGIASPAAHGLGKPLENALKMFISTKPLLNASVFAQNHP